MRHETRQFIQFGVWDRQSELLREARGLHRANRAVRESRRGAQLATATDATAAARRYPAIDASRLGGVARLRLPSLSWRSAAARMGTSLVTLGRRLECIGRVGVVGRG